MSVFFKLIILFLAVVSFQLSTFAQVQIGGDIDGEAFEDQLGFSVSMPDAFTLAVGAPFNDGGADDGGHVRIYRKNKNSWVQKGNDIDGGAADDLSGYSVSMPDSNTVAIGAPYHYGSSVGTYSGQVRIYYWNGFAWVQKGNDIIGEEAADLSSWSVSMPDNNTVAIGAPGNDDNGTLSGHVRIYKWNGNSWIQKGLDINGEAASDQSGQSISMPDSNTVAIGAPFNDGNGSNSGHVRIYRWNGNSWIKKGSDINGEAIDDVFGYSVSMPDSNTVTIGAPNYDGNGSNSGQVVVYQWNGSLWMQKGNDINGDTTGDLSGYSVSMPDENTLSIGAPYSNENDTSSGKVRTFKWNGSLWVQKGSSIIGGAKADVLGRAISMSDSNNLAIGIPGYGFVNTGQVQVYSFCNTLDTFSITACNRYVSPSNEYVWTSSGIYQDVIPNALGCDSLITVILTINQDNYITITPVVCNSFTSPSGNYTWTTSGQYTDTLMNAVGCDSIIFIDLTIDTINTSVSISGNSLIADETTATSYQWFDCDNNMTAIPGEVNRAYIPSDMSTSYAVAIEKNGCIDTSDCISITGLFDHKDQRETITIYPNPSNGLFTIDYPFTNENKVFTVTDINGKVVREGVIKKDKTQLNLSEFVSGIYLLRIEDAVVKLVLN